MPTVSSPFLAKFPHYNIKKRAAILDHDQDSVFRKWLDGKSVPAPHSIVESPPTISLTLPIGYLSMECWYKEAPKKSVCLPKGSNIWYFQYG